MNSTAITTSFPSDNEWLMMKEQARILINTGFLPKSIDTPEKAIGIMLKGRELQIGPMLSFSHIAIIEGKPTISPELMLMLIFKAHPNAKLNYITLNDEVCKIEVGRPGQESNFFEWTMADAKRAGLANKYNWKNYPRAMLRSRCIAEMARSLFPDAIAGCSYTPEELGAKTNEDQTEIVEAVEIKEPQPKLSQPKMVTGPQLTRMFAIIGETDLTAQDVKDHMKKTYDIDSSKLLTMDQYSQLINWIQEYPRKAREEVATEALVEELDEVITEGFRVIGLKGAGEVEITKPEVGDKT